MIFLFNDTATTEFYTLSLHDALPILIWKLLEVTASYLGKNDAMVDWISAIIASIFGAGETVEEILEEE